MKSRTFFFFKNLLYLLIFLSPVLIFSCVFKRGVVRKWKKIGAPEEHFGAVGPRATQSLTHNHEFVFFFFWDDGRFLIQRRRGCCIVCDGTVLRRPSRPTFWRSLLNLHSLSASISFSISLVGGVRCGTARTVASRQWYSHSDILLPTMSCWSHFLNSTSGMSSTESGPTAYVLCYRTVILSLCCSCRVRSCPRFLWSRPCLGGCWLWECRCAVPCAA